MHRIIQLAGRKNAFGGLSTDGLLEYLPFHRQPSSFVSQFGHTITKTGAICYADGAMYDGSDDKHDTGSEWIGTGACTLMAVIKPYTWGGSSYGRVLDNGKFIVFAGSGKITAESDGSTTATSATDSITLNQWSVIFVTRAADGTANIYIGSLATPPALSGSANQVSGTPASGITNVIIGNRNAGDRAFCGQIGNVAVWNRVLTLGEITANWQAVTRMGVFVQPFNLLTNGGFETGDPPTGWTLSGAGATWAQTGADKYTGSCSGLLTRNGTDCEAGQLVASGYQVGRAYTFAAMANCAVANRAYMQIWDGAGGTGGYCSGDGTWTRAVYTRTLSAGANQLKAILKVINDDTSAYFDNAILVQGDHI